jgi:hypothetical protein
VGALHVLLCVDPLAHGLSPASRSPVEICREPDRS